MANVTWEQAMSNTTTTNTTRRNNVGFFKLQKDGDEAIVRIMCDSTDDFDIVSTHGVKLPKFTTINCPRTPSAPTDDCPLCKRGVKVNQNIYIKLLVYTMDNNGQITATPQVWSRGMAYAYKLKSYIDNYGPLSEIVCKITRHGREGDIHTTYDIIPNLNPSVYSKEAYPIDREAFAGYKALGNAVRDWNFEELLYVAENNAMPPSQVRENSQTTSQAVPTQTAPPAQQFTPQPMNQTPPMSSTTPPWENDAPVAPTRYY